MVPTVSKYLQTGDYSILGWEDRIAIERKSLVDLYGTLTAGRDRFINELHRLQALEWACVIVEADWSAVPGPMRSKVNPESIKESIVAFRQRFWKVHWIPCQSRRLAEEEAFRSLNRFHKDRQQGGCYYDGEDAQAHTD